MLCTRAALGRMTGRSGGTIVVETPHLDEVMRGHAVAEGTTVILACSNVRLIEFDAYGDPGWDGMLVEPYTMKAGHVTADERPGLGVELADDAFERFSLLRR
jgi:L-alanine-DL-glutamate epimerase-like enolase superfamily enzyme